eukprot:2896549-Pyramimonas_sp.AAC.1
MARSFPAGERPMQVADPDSKTSRRKAEARGRARSLPPEFQATHLELDADEDEQACQGAIKPFFIAEEIWSSCRPDALPTPAPRAGQLQHFARAIRPEAAGAVSKAGAQWIFHLSPGGAPRRRGEAPA